MINAVFLALIPKMGSAKDLKDFRPISLCFYKLLAKFLANRLTKGLGGLISKVKHAFME